MAAMAAAATMLSACSLYFGDDDQRAEPETEPEAPRGVCRPMDPQVQHAAYAACWFVYASPNLYGGATPLYCEPGADPGHAFRTWTKVTPAGETWQIICGCPDDGSGCPDEKIGRLPSGSPPS